MKIGIIGPSSTVEVIQRVITQDIPDVTPLCACCDFFEESDKIADKFQLDAAVDAILFSGPTNYRYALRRIKPRVPWGFLPHNQTSLLQAFLTAQALYHSDLKAISVDRYDAALLKTTLETCGIRDSAVYRAPYDAEEAIFEHKLLEFHRSCYRQRRVSVCFTSMEHIREPLLSEGIPCIRIYPAEGIIREQIYRLQLRCASAQENAGKLAVISIRLDGSLNDETNLNFQEWERIQHQNAFCDQIYTLAQQMEAAVFSSNNNYFIVTTRSVLTNIFLKNDTHSKLMQFHRRHPDYSVWIGIGMGSTMLEAKSRSLLALNRSVTSRSQNVYLIEDDSLNLEALQVASNPVFDLSHFTHQTGISAKTLGILKQAISLDNAPITAAALAERMGITERSVNRIIALLEDNGCVSIVGKVTTGKGRPARSMRITLPDYI